MNLTATRNRPAAGVFLIAIAPFLITWSYLYGLPFPQPPWLTWSVLGGAVTLGACGLLLLPMSWGWRAVVAPLYFLGMAAMQFVWMLAMACSVHGDCL